MALVLGIDPGNSGAFVLVDSATRRVVAVEDMPVRMVTVGRKKRPRLDMVALDEVVAGMAAAADLVVLEDPGARPRQAGQMAFGIGLGMVKHALHCVRARVEEIVPRVWKDKMRAPADKVEAVKRAEELFPHDREKFRGPRGGGLDGVAEAAMLALYGIEHYLKA